MITAIIVRASVDTGLCHATIDALADDTRLPVPAVERALDELLALQWLSLSSSEASEPAQAVLWYPAWERLEPRLNFLATARAVMAGTAIAANEELRGPEKSSSWSSTTALTR